VRCLGVFFGSCVVGRATWVASLRLGPSEVIAKPVAWALCDRAA